MESLHPHLISTRSESDNWKPSRGAAVCQPLSRGSHWWLPCGFYFPHGIPQARLTACQIYRVPQPAALRTPYPSWWEAVSNCAEHLCQLLFPGILWASSHSAFRMGLPSSNWHFCPKTSQESYDNGYVCQISITSACLTTANRVTQTIHELNILL